MSTPTDITFANQTVPTTSAFRFNASTVFLTFPHSSFDLKPFIDQLHARYPIKKWIICKERHEDGDPHIHACISFVRKINVRNCRIFDYEGRHPHFGAVLRWKDAVAYCKKDGDFLQDGCEDAGRRRSPNDVYREAATTCQTREEYIEFLAEHAPRDSVIFWSQISRKADVLFPEPISAYVPNFEVRPFSNVPVGALEWAERYLASGFQGRPKALVLIGRTRIGKTAWARSLGPHIYMNGYYSVKSLINGEKEAKYVIFDDFLFDRIPLPRVFFGGQQEFTMTDKYFGKHVFTNWSKPVIFLWNEFPIIANEGLRDYVEGNSDKITCRNSFF